MKNISQLKTASTKNLYHQILLVALPQKSLRVVKSVIYVSCLAAGYWDRSEQ
jgi:hypothetical protein